MPVPRLFEASADPREQWVHVLATLLALGGPETRTALVEEISGEALPSADALLVLEQRPLPDAPTGSWPTSSPAARAGPSRCRRRWPSTRDEEERLAATHDAPRRSTTRCILIAITPDRKPPPAVERAAEGGRDVRHRSWLRVRDWVQERPERGRAQGTDLLLLREAEYFLTPRVAELYRLEGLMPMVDAGLRPSLAGMFFDLNELAPAPLIQNEAGRRARGLPAHRRRRRPRSRSAGAASSLTSRAPRPGPATPTASDGLEAPGGRRRRRTTWRRGPGRSPPRGTCCRRAGDRVTQSLAGAARRRLAARASAIGGGGQATVYRARHAAHGARRRP